jgi:hypothetical protein
MAKGTIFTTIRDAAGVEVLRYHNDVDDVDAAVAHVQRFAPDTIVPPDEIAIAAARTAPAPAKRSAAKRAAKSAPAKSGSRKSRR